MRERGIETEFFPWNNICNSNRTLGSTSEKGSEKKMREKERIKNNERESMR